MLKSEIRNPPKLPFLNTGFGAPHSRAPSRLLNCWSLLRSSRFSPACCCPCWAKLKSAQRS